MVCAVLKRCGLSERVRYTASKATQTFIRLQRTFRDETLRKNSSVIGIVSALKSLKALKCGNRDQIISRCLLNIAIVLGKWMGH